jgi:lysophospholipase L1-like esterase
MHSNIQPVEPTFPKIFYWITPPLACLLTIALVELGLALFWSVPFVSEHNMYYVADPHTGFRLQPNSQGRFRSGVLGTVNSHGHRDDESPRRKPSGTFRILVLGDSFTQGSNVEQDDTYPQVLERLLKEHLDTPSEVINTGVGGWDPYQYAEYYEHYGQVFEPDMVLIGFFVGNDTYSREKSLEETRTAIAGRRVTRESANHREVTRAKIVLYSNFHLVRLFSNRGRFTLKKNEIRNLGSAPRDGGQFPKKYLEIQTRRMKVGQRKRTPTIRQQAQNSVVQISRIKTLADIDSIPVMVLLIPDENQINSSLASQVVLGSEEPVAFDLNMPQQMLRPLFEAQGIHVVDPMTDFLADERRLYMNDSHWSSEGHRLMAERLLGEILPRFMPGGGS